MSEASHTLHLFDDRKARGFRPFAESRPVGELLLGCLLLRERAQRALGLRCVAHHAGAARVGFEEPGAPPAVYDSNFQGSPRVFLSSRAVLDLTEVSPLPGGPATITMGGEPVGWILDPTTPDPEEDHLLDPTRLGLGAARVELPGWLLESPWQAMSENAEQVARDISAMHMEDRASMPEGVHILGGYRFSLAPDARVEPGAVIDVTEGPIRIEPGATVRAFTRLSGPAWIGPGSVVFGGTLGRVSLGPVCKFRGEVEESVVLGYSNKAHDGFLGHAYLGRWVNLGALTTNSDLKNNYGPVRLTLPEGTVDTGSAKVGCFLGDHVKTGIGTMLNTGTIVGPGSNLFGGVMPPKYVPAFSWGRGEDLDTYDLDRFLEVARTVMGRRNQTLPEGMVKLFRHLWAETAGERE